MRPSMLSVCSGVWFIYVGRSAGETRGKHDALRDMEFLPVYLLMNYLPRYHDL